jgi:hypothetical protein
MAEEREPVTPEQYEVVKAVLGADAEAFQRGKVGQYIFNRLEMEEERLIEELIAADPDDAKRGRLIRNDIYVRRSLPLFINEAIQTGNAAMRNLDQMESNTSDY